MERYGGCRAKGDRRGRNREIGTGGERVGYCMYTHKK